MKRPQEPSEPIAWTDGQTMAARAITLIRNNLAPTCDECGYSANGQKCAADLGGSCLAHEQENYIAFSETIQNLLKTSGLDKIYGWERKMPLHLFNDFDEKEIALLRDLRDAGGLLESRVRDVRFDSLSRKRAVYFSVTQKWFVIMTVFGEGLLAHIDAAQTTASTEADQD